MLTVATENREQQVADILRKMQDELEEMIGQLHCVQSEFRQRTGIDQMQTLNDAIGFLLKGRERVGWEANLIEGLCNQAGSFHGIPATREGQHGTRPS